MPIILTIGAVIIALGVGAFVYLSRENVPTSTPEPIRIEESVEVSTESGMDENVTDVPQNPTMTTPDETDTIQTTTSTGPTGTFTASGTYLTPARTSHTVEVTLTLNDGLVTDTAVSYDNKATGTYSNDNQNRFDRAYEAQVVGKSLDAISLSRVGGASLTSTAFNEAVNKIKLEAAG
jgi:hypothetical protein